MNRKRKYSFLEKIGLTKNNKTTSNSSAETVKVHESDKSQSRGSDDIANINNNNTLYDLINLENNDRNKMNNKIINTFNSDILNLSNINM